MCEARRNDDGSIKATVEPVALLADDPLYPLKGAAGGITIETDAGHSFTMLQGSSGIDDAAFGLIQDCRAIIDRSPQV